MDKRFDKIEEMLRSVISGQSVMKSELMGEIKRVEDKLTNRMDGLEIKIDKVEKRLTKRLDVIGSQVAFLEEDTPTREEFDALVVRVDKVEERSLVN